MESRRVLIELYAGIIIYTIFGIVVGVILGVIYGGFAWLFIPGLIAGSFVACYQAYHINKSLDKALGSGDGSKANNYMVLQSMIRLLISAAVMIVAVLICWQAFVGTAIGLMSLKISGYMNPLVRKLMGHNEERKDLNSLLMENSSNKKDIKPNPSETDESNSSDVTKVRENSDDDDDEEFDYTFKPIGMKGYKDEY